MMRSGKYDRLVKQVSIFEKVSLYGDRQSFLQRLAQVNSLDLAIGEAIEKLTTLLQSGHLADAPRLQIDSDLKQLYSLRGKSDEASLNRLQGIITALGPVVSNNQGANLVLPALSQLTEAVNQAKANLLSEMPEEKEVVNNMPETTVIGNPQNFVKIDPAIQRALNVSPDGKLGPETRKALDAYKQKKNPGMSDELAFEYLRKEPAAR